MTDGQAPADAMPRSAIQPVTDGAVELISEALLSQLLPSCDFVSCEMDRRHGSVTLRDAAGPELPLRIVARHPGGALAEIVVYVACVTR